MRTASRLALLVLVLLGAACSDEEWNGPPPPVHEYEVRRFSVLGGETVTVVRADNQSMWNGCVHFYLSRPPDWFGRDEVGIYCGDVSVTRGKVVPR